MTEPESLVVAQVINAHVFSKEGTKDTKFGDNFPFSYLTFVLFVSFVVKND